MPILPPLQHSWGLTITPQTTPPGITQQLLLLAKADDLKPASKVFKGYRATAGALKGALCVFLGGYVWSAWGGGYCVGGGYEFRGGGYERGLLPCGAG